MAELRLFAQAKDAAGCAHATVGGSTVEEVLANAVERFGDRLAEVIKVSAVWVNGEFAEAASPVGPDDEVAVLPPVSGG
ncbi:MAG TPA: MoaD/ThiS family protein [Acidimicrobiales bacterium]|nr:MoaD/ThiS family protein [Acidimicrobiales bacterium]